MLHEIYPHSFQNQYTPNKKIEEDDYILHFKGNSVLLKSYSDTKELPRRKDIVHNVDDSAFTFLFTFNGNSCFLVENLDADYTQFEFENVSFFRTTKQQELAWVCMVAFHLNNWYLNNKFCGKCGNPTKHKEDERALVCNSCHHTIYPTISPAIIVAIISGEKILLARGVNFRGNWFSLVAGYVDVGESLEETVKREVNEEVGINVTNICYYKSQPWGYSGSMMIGFVAQADENQPVVIDENEIAEAAWFTKDNLPEHPPKLSIAGEMIEKFKNGEL